MSTEKRILCCLSDITNIILNSTIRASSPCSTGLVDFVDRVSLALCNLLVEQIAIAAILEELIIIGKFLVRRVLRSCQVVVELLDDHISVVIEGDKQVIVGVANRFAPCFVLKNYYLNNQTVVLP